jgi:hypothetical protein
MAKKTKRSELIVMLSMLSIFRATFTILSVGFDVPSIIMLEFALLSVGITSVVLLSVVASFQQKRCVGVYRA